MPTSSSGGPVVWLGGGLVGAAAARIDPGDRGFLLGDGLFETIRVDGGCPVRLEAHLARLRQGAGVLDLPVPMADGALADAVGAVLSANGLRDASVRLTLTAGTGPRGLLRPAEPEPTLLITATTLPPPPGPARVVIARTGRRNEKSPLSRVKTLGYLDAILARREAAAQGADDALLLNTEGRVAEATAANLFVCIDGTWSTPPMEEGALPGTMRAVMLERLAAAERPLGPDDLSGVEAALLTSALGCRPVATLVGRPLSVETATAAAAASGVR